MQIQSINNNQPSFRMKLNLKISKRFITPEEINILIKKAQKASSPSDIIQAEIKSRRGRTKEGGFRLVPLIGGRPFKHYKMEVMTSINGQLSHYDYVLYYISEGKKLIPVYQPFSNKIQKQITPFDVLNKFIDKLAKKHPMVEEPAHVCKCGGHCNNVIDKT